MAIAVEENQTGQVVSQRREIEVLNPATGQVIGSIPVQTPAEIAEIVAKARAAQPVWESLGYDGRARIFKRAQKWVMDNQERLIEAVCAETGKTYEDVLGPEISYVAGAFGYWAKHASEYLADEKVRSTAPFVIGKKLVVRHAPVGVIGVIGPWNFPLTNSFGDCIPALAAGNSVVLKPSEVTPLSSLLTVEMMTDCGVPEGVYQVAMGDGSTGAALVDEVDMVMFTGSTATGKKVMQRAAETLTPVSLELGGKDPMIVLKDADLEKASNAASFYSMNNAGQICISVERVYVEEPIYDEFVSKVTEKVKNLRQGPPDGPGAADLGAVIFPPQVEIIERHVKDAVDHGAKVLTGGKRGPGPGLFYEPTVLVDVDQSMQCMQEETFGPTLPIMKVADADEAVRLANDSVFGLQSSIYTKDTERAELLARQLESGVVTVNDAQINYTAFEVPMGGWKTSGMGHRHGPGGIRKYTRQQTILVSKMPLKRDLHMFPYKKGSTKLISRFLKVLYGRGKRS